MTDIDIPPDTGTEITIVKKKPKDPTKATKKEKSTTKTKKEKRVKEGLNDSPNSPTSPNGPMLEPIGARVPTRGLTLAHPIPAMAGPPPSAVGPAGEGRPMSPRMRTSSMPLSHADADTYISVIKSDIFQVQMRMESLLRGIVRGADSRAMTPSRSKRHQELVAIRDSTEDVEAISKTTKNPTELKLRLLEHLMSSMMQLENHVLKATERAASARPSTAGSRATSPGLSRLPSFLGVHDRLLELAQKVEEAKGGGDTSLGHTIASTFEETCDELEDHISKLEGALAMRPPTSTGRFSDRLSPIQQVLSRIKKAGTSIEMIRDRGVRYLQQESEEIKKTSRAIAETLETTRRDLTLKLKDTEERLVRAQSSTPSAGAAAASASAATAAANANNAALDNKLEEYKQAAKSIEMLKNKEIERLQREIDRLKSKLAQEDKRRGEETERYIKDLSATESKVSADHNSAVVQVMHLQTELAEYKAKAAEFDERAHFLEQSLEKTREELSEERKIRTDLQQRYDDEVGTLRAQLEQTKKQMEGLVGDKCQNADDSLKQINQSLRAELSTTSEQMDKVKRAHRNLEFYMRDTALKQKMDNELQLLELRKLREQVGQQEKLQKELEVMTEENVAGIKKSLKGEDAVQDVFAQEMRSMKLGFELKLNKAKEDLARATRQHSQQTRLLSDQLEEQRKSGTQQIATLRSALEALEQKRK